MDGWMLRRYIRFLSPFIVADAALLLCGHRVRAE